MKTEIEKQIRDAITICPLSMMEAAKTAQMPYMTFVYRAQKLGLYVPNQSHKGRKIPSKGPDLIPLNEILEGLHPQYARRLLKKRLLDEGLKENKCEECGCNQWNNKPLICHLDHIDGNSTNHLWINLKMLCPNCHSQTPTYAGRNIKLIKERRTT